MTIQSNTPTTKKEVDVKGGLTAGVILVTIGLSLLVFNWLSLEMAFPALLALIFVAAGIATRSAGLLIPGGIIGGVALGILATENNWFAAQGTQESGGIMLLSMATGFFSIIVLSKLFSRDTQIWPIFPAGTLALIGGLVMMGANGLAVLEVLGRYWPVILVLVGLSVLVRTWKERSAS